MTGLIDRKVSDMFKLMLFTAVIIFAVPLFSGDSDAVGGVDIVIDLEEGFTGSTEESMIDISRGGYEDVVINGYVTISTETPHILQQVSVVFSIEHVEPDVVDDADINMEVDPPSLNLMGVRPGTELNFEIQVRIRVDNWIPGGENLFNFGGSWAVTPAVQQSGELEPESFTIHSKPFSDGYMDAPDEVEVPLDTETVFTVDLYNTGNTVPNFYPDLDKLSARDMGFYVNRGEIGFKDRIEHDERSGWVNYHISPGDSDDVVPGIRSSIKLVLQDLSNADTDGGDISGIVDLDTVYIDLVFVEGSGGTDPPPNDDPPDDETDPDNGDPDNGDDHIEANIDIVITEALNRRLANDDTVILEISIKGTTSGCEMLWLGTGVTFSDGLVFVWADEEFDIKEGIDPLGLSEIYEEAYFRDTSAGGDWSSFEFKVKVEMDMSDVDGFDRDEYLDSALDLEPALYKIRAFPDSNDENRYSEEIVKIPVTTGVVPEEGGSGNYYFTIGIIASIIGVLIVLFVGLLVYTKMKKD